ncbi:hypothetical protein BVX97_03305 [bacterium E08(2017)]|nr:hypothetical protein BVX97_03305 [bacterium E08(2017)]
MQEGECEVYVAGTFNNWSDRDKKMKQLDDGVYSTSIMIPKGRHEYKFVINGEWSVDPECQEWTSNSMGSLNSVINV